MAFNLSSKNSWAEMDSGESSTMELSIISGDGCKKNGMLYLDAEDSVL